MAGEIFYIDENGHTGDLLTSGNAFDFSGQPHFVLGAVGPTDEKHVSEVLAKVAAKYRLRMREIKSDRLARRPAFARDLVAALCRHEVPVFVEAVDKLFFLMACIVNCHILPPSAGAAGGEDDRRTRNDFADFLYRSLPDSVLAMFLAACRSDTPDAVRASLDEVLAWARRETAHDDEERVLLEGIAGNMVESINDFERVMPDDPLGHRRFLPVPDAGKRDTTYWVLPHYSSLTNLYARINRFQRGRLANVTLVHDEQRQYDTVLGAAKAAVEGFEGGAGWVTPGADYAFGEKATLCFARSADSPGLMVADVIAGHVRRVLREHMAERAMPHAALDAFIELLDTSDEAQGTGLNLVLPTAAVQRLHVRALLRRACSQGSLSRA